MFLWQARFRDPARYQFGPGASLMSFDTIPTGQQGCSFCAAG